MEWGAFGKDLVAGTLGGVAGIVAGYPLDTLKTRMQTSQLGHGPVSMMSQVLKKEGVRGFYKGMLSPIVSNAPINAVVFAGYGVASRVIQEMDQTVGEPMTTRQHLIAGGAAGLVQTAFASPSELVKIVLQVDSKAAKTSSVDCAKQIARDHGVKGLYRGLGMTIMRDVPAFAVYFYSYEEVKHWLTNGDRVNETTGNLLMAGGIAGTLSWLLLHPVDVVKSCTQSQPVSSGSPIPLGARQVLRQNVAKDGPRFLLKGLTATVLRAFPVSAVTFMVYEKTMQMMEDSPAEIMEGIYEAMETNKPESPVATSDKNDW